MQYFNSFYSIRKISKCIAEQTAEQTEVAARLRKDLDDAHGHVEVPPDLRFVEFFGNCIYILFNSRTELKEGIDKLHDSEACAQMAK